MCAHFPRYISKLTVQLIGTCSLGFMGFSAVSFFLSLYLQNLKHLSALEITVQLLPMVVSGVLVNVVCGLVLHRISNKILTGIGALAYTAAFLILSFMKQESSYWAFIFPGLVLVVVGADIQFNVTNVHLTPRVIPIPCLWEYGLTSSRCTSCPPSRHPSNPSPAVSSTPSSSCVATWALVLLLLCRARSLLV